MPNISIQHPLYKIDNFVTEVEITNFPKKKHVLDEQYRDIILSIDIDFKNKIITVDNKHRSFIEEYNICKKMLKRVLKTCKKRDFLLNMYSEFNHEKIEQFTFKILKVLFHRDKVEMKYKIFDRTKLSNHFDNYVKRTEESHGTVYKTLTLIIGDDFSIDKREENPYVIDDEGMII